MPLETIVWLSLTWQGSGTKQFGMVEINDNSKFERTDASGVVDS